MPITALLGAFAFIYCMVCLAFLIRALESGNETLVWARASEFIAWTAVSILSFELMGCPV